MFFDFSTSPQIDTVFYKEDLTLIELLDQENILQELKSQNKKLIDFLIRPEVLLELVTLITTEPKEDLPEADRYRHPHIACELLTTGIPQLNERLIDDEATLSKLYMFIEVEPPLNPLLASFFSRTVGELVTKRSEQNWFSYQFMCLKVLEFLKSKESCISLIMKHLGTSAIMDLVLNFVNKVEGGEMKTNFLNWMASQRLIENLIDLLEPSLSSSLHSNSASLLCDIISKTRENQRLSNDKTEIDPLLNTLESCETIQKLLQVILGKEKSESSIVGGITILIALLEPQNYMIMEQRDNGCDSPVNSHQSQVEQFAIEAILPYLPALHDLLLNPPYKVPVKMTCGIIDPPLGNTRLHVIKLIATLISKHNSSIEYKLTELGTIQILLDLFFRYTWNNFLHTLVKKCLALAINVDSVNLLCPDENSLLFNTFIKSKLLQRILDAWKENELEESKPGGCRRGYMAHLIQIANVISSRTTESSLLDELLKKHVPEEEIMAWNTFIAGPIANINKTNEVCLGGKHPMHSSSDDGSDFKDVNFPQDSALQQVYSEYNKQQVAAEFIDSFGFQESEFNESDDNLHPSVDRLNFSLNLNDNDELDKRAEMFKQVCEQKLQPLASDDNDEEEVWIDQNVRSSLFNFKIWNGGEEAAYCNSSDDDNDERPGPEGREEKQMHIDSNNLDNTVNPWSVDESHIVKSTSFDEEGWADFEANFSVATFSESEEIARKPKEATSYSVADSNNETQNTTLVVDRCDSTEAHVISQDQNKSQPDTNMVAGLKAVHTDQVLHGGQEVIQSDQAVDHALKPVDQGGVNPTQEAIHVNQGAVNSDYGVVPVDQEVAAPGSLGIIPDQGVVHTGIEKQEETTSVKADVTFTDPV